MLLALDEKWLLDLGSCRYPRYVTYEGRHGEHVSTKTIVQKYYKKLEKAQERRKESVSHQQGSTTSELSAAHQTISALCEQPCPAWRYTTPAMAF